MEEILASIRRIIEDSEPLQADDRDTDAEAEAAPFRDDLKPANEQADRASDAGDSGVLESAFADADETAAEPEKAATESDDETAVSARKTTDAFDALRMEPEPRVTERTPGEGGNQEARKTMHHQQPPPEDGAAAMPGAQGSETKAPSWQKPEDAEPARRPTDAEKPREEQTPLAPLAPRAKAGAEETRKTILSEASGRKVAAAFSELNEAYEASRRKSLADAAEEMLQPMLQEWLDNNLPQLVERLVREEIERIARGSSEDGQSGR